MDRNKVKMFVVSVIDNEQFNGRSHIELIYRMSRISYILYVRR